MGITVPQGSSSLADEFANVDVAEFDEVTPADTPTQIEISDKLDGEIFAEDFDEDPVEVAGALKHNFSPAHINTVTKDPLETIMLYSDVDKDTAKRTLEVAAIAPSLPVVPYDRDVLDYAEESIAQDKATRTYNYLKQNAPDFISSITNPHAAKLILDSTANGELVWSQLHDLMVERNDGFFGRSWQALKSGGSSLAKSTGESFFAVGEVLDKINDGYIEELDNGGRSLEQDKSLAESNDLKQHYNCQIEELKFQLNKHRGTDTGVKLANQIFSLEEKRDEAVKTITARGDSKYKEEVLIAKSVAKDLKEQTAEIRTYLDSAPWLNKMLMSDAVFHEKTIAAVPQVLQQVMLYAVGAKEAALSLTAAQSFSSSYSRSRKEDVSIPVALVTASLRSVIETAGEAVTFGLLGRGSGAAKKLLLSESVTKSALKDGSKAIAGSVIKEVATESAQNALGTGVEAVGYAIDEVMTASEIGDFLFDEGIVGSAEEGAIAGVLMLPSIGGVSLAQLNRINDAKKRTENLMELVNKAESISEDTKPKVKEELIKAVTPNQSNENATEYFQDSSELAQAVTAEVVQEVKIHAGALQAVLDSDYTDTAEKVKLLTDLGISEEDIGLEVEHGGYVSTTATKAATYGGSVFWEKVAPYTLQYDQEMTLADTERFATAIDSVSEVMKELDSSEIILTRSEREQAAYKMLKEVYTTKSDDKSIKAASVILSRLFESIERGSTAKSRNSIMANISHGFAVKRGENGNIHFLHKNDLADIRAKRATLKEKKGAINAKKGDESKSAGLELEEVELSAQEKDEAVFRGQEGIGDETSSVLASIDPNTDLYSVNGVALLEAMVADGVIADSERELFVENGIINKDGIEFVNNSLLSKMLDNSALLDSLNIQTKKKLVGITPYILGVDALSSEQSILADLREAMLYTGKLKRKKLTDIESNAGKLDTWFNSRPKAHIEQAVRAYLETVRLGSSMSKDELVDEIIRSGERFLSKAEKLDKLNTKKEQIEEAEVITEIAIEEATEKEAALKESTVNSDANEELQKQLEEAQK